MNLYLSVDEVKIRMMFVYTISGAALACSIFAQTF